MRIALLANTDWYLFNFRLPLADELRRLGAEVLLLSPNGRYGPRLCRKGLRWLPVPIDRSNVNPFREMMALRELTRIYRAERPDLVHHFTLKCVLLGSLAAHANGIQARVNAITGLGHIFNSANLRARALRLPVKLGLKLGLRGHGSRLILQNADNATVIEDLGLIKARNVRLIRGSGIDTERFVPRKARDVRAAQFRVLLAARLVVEKGVLEYVAAARQLKKEGINAEFLLAGDVDDGSPVSLPREVVRSWADSGVVKLLGHVDDMAACLQDVDAVVLPSHGEGLPRSLLEAASCALPIVATDVPGCRDVVEHGVNGFLVPAGDSEALARAIRRLFDDPAEAAQMGRAGREKVRREFDVRIVLAQTIAVYRELLPGLGNQIAAPAAGE